MLGQELSERIGLDSPGLVSVVGLERSQPTSRDPFAHASGDYAASRRYLGHCVPLPVYTIARAHASERNTSCQAFASEGAKPVVQCATLDTGKSNKTAYLGTHLTR